MPQRACGWRALSESSVEAFLVVNMLTGMPLIALLMSWSIWYGVRSFRRSEEWGEAIRLLEELDVGVTARLALDDATPSRHPRSRGTHDAEHRTDTDVVYNPFEPGFTDDPYPHYQALRSTSRCARPRSGSGC